MKNELLDKNLQEINGLNSKAEKSNSEILRLGNELNHTKSMLKKIEVLELDLRETNTNKQYSETELERVKSEYESLKIINTDLQGKVDNLNSEAKSDLKEKDAKIEQLMHEISDYKDHMVKTIELRKISHSNDLQNIQNQLNQVEAEKSQYFYQLQAAQKDLKRLEKDMKTSNDNYKKELMESYDKLQQ